MAAHRGDALRQIFQLLVIGAHDMHGLHGRNAFPRGVLVLSRFLESPLIR
jgi:hypothetical protein